MGTRCGMGNRHCLGSNEGHLVILYMRLLTFSRIAACIGCSLRQEDFSCNYTLAVLCARGYLVGTRCGMGNRHCLGSNEDHLVILKV